MMVRVRAPVFCVNKMSGVIDLDKSLKGLILFF